MTTNQTDPAPPSGPAWQMRQTLLRGFTDDTRRMLEGNPSEAAKLTARHIGRQLDLAASPRYAEWFRRSAAAGFDQDVTLAAVAGSDVTRPSMACEAARANFGSTSDRVRQLAAAGDLRYGRVFDDFTSVEDLYMHAEAGRHYALQALRRRGQEASAGRGWARTAAEVADAIMGHDSFNAGFGARKLKPLLALRHGGVPEGFGYPASQTANGFLVQILDRLEAFEPETMFRYVSEAVLSRKEPVAAAIATGIIDNFEFLRDVHDCILLDSRQRLPAGTMAALLAFPGLQDYGRCLKQAPVLLALLGTPPDRQPDGEYHLRFAGGDVALDSLRAVREHFIPAMQAAMGAC